MKKCKRETIMKENTKKYLKDLIDDLTVEANTVESLLEDIQKSLKKIRQFYKKVVIRL